MSGGRTEASAPTEVYQGVRRGGALLPTVVPTDSRALLCPPIRALPRNRLASSATGGASPISPPAGDRKGRPYGGLQVVQGAGRCGERTERCQWQRKRSERVAAVKILSVRRKAAQKFWAPQQDHRSYGSVSWGAVRGRITKPGGVYPGPVLVLYLSAYRCRLFSWVSVDFAIFSAFL